MKTIITHAAALYLGAGLSLGLIMSQVLPLNALGVGYYSATWPFHVYCARPSANCFGIPAAPLWIGPYIFDLEQEG